MSKCINCGVEILDKAEHCPLCHAVLSGDFSGHRMYPDLRLPTRRLALASRIYLFCAILLETILVGLNLYLEHQVLWCVISGLVLLYIYLLIGYAIMGKSGYQSKTLFLTTIAILCAVAIDFATGYRGWALEYVLPGGILFIDLACLILMFTNRRNWHSYIVVQLFMIVCSLIPAAFFFKGLEKNIFIALLPLAVSVYLFLGTMIIGGRKARLELKRRFHF